MSTLRRILFSQIKKSISSGGISVSFIRQQFKHGYVATSVTFDSPVIAGDCIIVAVLSSSVAASGCSDSLGNSYTLINTQAGNGGFMSIFAAFSISGGTCVVTESGAGGDIGLTAVEYSGPTSVDTFNSGNGVNPSLSLTTTSTDMFFACYGSETSNFYVSSALNPLGVAPVQIQFDGAHIDGEFEWLNSSSGFSAGNYTVDLNGIGIWMVVALKSLGNVWSPTTPSNTLVEWLKADALALSNGATVSTWTATAGNNAILQAGSVTFSTNNQNGLPGINFTGTGYMKCADFGASITQPFTMMIVYRNTDLSIFPSEYLTASSEDIQLAINIGGVQLYAGGADYSDSVAPRDDSVTHVLYIEWNGSSTKYSLDGGTETTIINNPGSSSLQTLYLGATSTGLKIVEGYLFELNIWNGQLNSTDKPAAINYAKTKWGI